MKHQTTRFLSLLMAVIMAFSCAEVAFAADVDVKTSDENTESDEETGIEIEPVGDIAEEEPAVEDVSGGEDEPEGIQPEEMLSGEDEQATDSGETTAKNENDEENEDAEDYGIDTYSSPISTYSSTYASPYSYTIGSTKTITFSDSEDDFWFKIKVPSDGDYVFTMQNNTDNSGRIVPALMDEYLVNTIFYAYVGGNGGTCAKTITLEAGTYYLEISRLTFMFAGNGNVTFSLNAASVSKPTISSAKNTSSGIKLTWKKISNAKGYYVYRKTGSGSYSKIKTIKSKSTVTYTDKSAKNGKTYTYKVIAYSSNNKSSGATKKAVRLTTPSVKSVKNSSSKKATVKWKKKSSVSGYQIQYSTKKSFSSKKTVTAGKSKTSKKLTKLKKGKTYYVRIRSYKTVSGKKYYSAWSSKKSVKIKK